MAGISSLLKSAIHALDDTMRSLGKEVNIQDLEAIVKEHCAIGAASGVAAAVLPGAGPTVAYGVSLTSIITMYVRLSSALGVKLGKNVIKALASAVVADVSAAVLGSLAISTAFSLVPLAGQALSGFIVGAGNYGTVYLAALIFIKMLAVLLREKKDISSMSVSELIQQAQEVSSQIDKKSAMREAKAEYKKEKDKKSE